MKRKIIKTIFITLLIALITFIIVYNMGIKISRNNLLEDEYKEYYVYKHDYSSEGIFETIHYSRVWFLPFQKKSLLNQLQKDVYSLLEDFVKSNEDFTIDYVISDDFKKVIIYVDDPNHFNAPGYANLTDEVIKRVFLYQELLHGYDSIKWGDIIKLTYI